MRTKPMNEKGNTLIVVMILTASLAVTTMTFFTNTLTNNNARTSSFAQKRVFYVAEGARVIGTVLTQDYIRSHPDFTTAGLNDYLKTNLPPVLPPDYALKDLKATILSTSPSAPLTTGVFKGMRAPQVLVNLSFQIENTTSSAMKSTQQIDASIAIAQIGLHQFLYFFDVATSGYAPGEIAELDGRVHANGDLCLGFMDMLSLEYVTASGRLMSTKRKACGTAWNDSALPGAVRIARGPGFTNFKSFGVGGDSPNPSDRDDNGCKNCLGSGMDWADFALSSWKGHVLDAAHGVPKLGFTLPDTIQTQAGGTDSGPFMAASNQKNLRFLVDPVLPADEADVKKLKYAYQSDIRIIDGVWYLRSATNPDAWPGDPIWSDHPGHFKDAWGKDVGQVDLRKAGRWTTVSPRRYSYYEYDAGAHSLSGDISGIVSYGVLARTAGAHPSWAPGHLLDLPASTVTTAGKTVRASRDFLCVKPDGTPDSLDPATPLGNHRFTDNINCVSAPAPSVATAILNGTRGGFHDGHVAIHSKLLYEDFPLPANAPEGRANILPTNFNVDQFQQALRDHSMGELGWYFIGRKFNGIVYITSTWPKSMDGFSDSTAPAPWPAQKDGDWPAGNNQPQVRVGDLSQIELTSRHMQRSLPFPLCTEPVTSLPTDPIPQPGTEFDRIADVSKFVIPSCRDYGSALFAYPNAIRVHDGWNMDPNVLPVGLSIVSNLPVYVLGDYNSSSDASSQTATPWIPALLAGDTVTALSNAWDDANGPFAVDHLDGTGEPTTRIATPTVYNASFLAGWAGSRVLSDPDMLAVQMNTFVSMLENWRGQKMTIQGSISAGFYPVYSRGQHWRWDPPSGPVIGGPYPTYYYSTYTPPDRDIKYDRHLELINKQPAGSPTFYTSSVRTWKTD